MSVWQDINVDLGDIITKAEKSVVQIHGKQGNMGSGVIWSDDGWIVTNAHVVLSQWGQSSFDVMTSDGRSFPARIHAYDRSRDLAVVVADADNLAQITLPPASLVPHPGQWVMAVGHPLGVSNAVSMGVVIGAGNDLPERIDNKNWIALDLRLRPGNSGGPIIDQEGNLVGISTMIRGPEVGYAIPVETVQAFIAEVKSKTQPPIIEANESVIV